MSNPFSIASFDNFEPAQVLADRLRKEGFQASARSDAAEQIWKLYNLHPRAHCHVFVPTSEADAALRRLNELDLTEQVLKDAVRCPECGSSQIEYPQFSRRTIVGALPAIAAAAGIVEREFFCAACQFTWPPSADPADVIPAGKDVLR